MNTLNRTSANALGSFRLFFAVVALGALATMSVACSDDKTAAETKPVKAEVKAEVEEAPKDKYAMAAAKEVTADNAEKMADDLEKQLDAELKEVDEEAAK